MAPGSASRSTLEIELTKLSSPRIFLVRMLVFLVLCSLLLVVLYKQIVAAFMANPGLNALIIAVLLIGTILSFRQVIRLYPEVRWVNNFRISDPGLAIDRRPVLLAPMAERRICASVEVAVLERLRQRLQRPEIAVIALFVNSVFHFAVLCFIMAKAFFNFSISIFC